MTLLYRGRPPRTPGVWMVKSPSLPRETIMAALVANGYDKNNTQVYHLRREDVMVIAPLYCTSSGGLLRCRGIGPGRDTIEFQYTKDDDAAQPRRVEYRLTDLSPPPLTVGPDRAGDGCLQL